MIKVLKKNLFFIFTVVSMGAIFSRGFLESQKNFGVFYYICIFLTPAMYYFIAFREGQKISGAWGIILLLIGAWLIFDTWTPLSVTARGVMAFVGVALPFFIGQRLHKNPITAEKVK